MNLSQGPQFMMQNSAGPVAPGNNAQQRCAYPKAPVAAEYCTPMPFSRPVTGALYHTLNTAYGMSTKRTN